MTYRYKGWQTLQVLECKGEKTLPLVGILLGFLIKTLSIIFQSTLDLINIGSQTLCNIIDNVHREEGREFAPLSKHLISPFRLPHTLKTFSFKCCKTIVTILNGVSKVGKKEKKKNLATSSHTFYSPFDPRIPPSKASYTATNIWFRTLWDYINNIDRVLQHPKGGKRAWAPMVRLLGGGLQNTLFTLSMPPFQ